MSSILNIFEIGNRFHFVTCLLTRASLSSIQLSSIAVAALGLRPPRATFLQSCLLAMLCLSFHTYTWPFFTMALWFSRLLDMEPCLSYMHVQLQTAEKLTPCGQCLLIFTKENTEWIKQKLKLLFLWGEVKETQ